MQTPEVLTARRDGALDIRADGPHGKHVRIAALRGERVGATAHGAAPNEHSEGVR
jgi:hypothetical protein